MMDFLILAGGILAKCLAMGVMIGGCVAIYLVEVRKVVEEA